MRILVCGGRNYNDQGRINQVLDRILHKRGITLLIEGGAQGADTLGFEWACRKRLPTKTFPADWCKHGRSAGPIRNQQMLREGKPDAVVAFPGGKGTAHMVSIAKKAGVPVWEIK